MWARPFTVGKLAARALAHRNILRRAAPRCALLRRAAPCIVDADSSGNTLPDSDEFRAKDPAPAAAPAR